MFTRVEVMLQKHRELSFRTSLCPSLVKKKKKLMGPKNRLYENHNLGIRFNIA